MKFAHIQIPDFPIQVEILADPSLRRKAVVMGGFPEDEGDVTACSPMARRSGVKVGMRLRHAGQLAPEAVFLPADGDRESEAHHDLMSTLGAFSPLRQTLAPGEVCFEASGLGGLFGPDLHLIEQLSAQIREHTGLLPKVGLARNRFTAEIAAELAELGEGVVVAKGGEAEFLAPLGIEVMPRSQEAHQLLTRLGLLTVGQVAELPAGALSRTLGREGDRLHRLAHGVDRTPLVPEYEQLPLLGRINLDWPLEHLPALVANTEVLLSRLSDQLAAEGLAAGNVIVSVEQEDGKVRTAWGYLRPASSELDKLLDRAAGLLKALDYTAGVTGLSVSLSPLEPAHFGARQIPIGSGNAVTSDPLSHTLHTIRVRFGDGSIRDAAALSEPPPEPVEVRVNENGDPVSLSRDGSWTRIRRIQLHWRLEGDWWWRAPDAGDGLPRTAARPPSFKDGRQAAGRKDYYQVVSRAGQILVLLLCDGDWYLHGAAKPNQWPPAGVG